MGKIYEYKVLRVDLTNEEIKTEKIVGDDVKNYLGGRGLAPKNPPELLLAIVPVRGPLVTTI